MKSLLRTATLVLLAYAISELFYWRWVVPKLPHLHQVPLAWWLGVYAPFGLAAVAAGATLPSKRDIPRHACFAASIPLGAPVVRSLITVAPIGHDTALQDLVWDPTFWALVVASFAVMTVMFAAALALGHVAAAVRVRAG